MNTEREYLTNAEIAFSNEQYETALSWYKKALESSPTDIYALSRAGAISVMLNQFEDALRFFQKAKDLDPQNGDNFFNYGNACFFNKNYHGAFESYVEAEKLGCSEDVLPRLYYQMALLCSMRQEIKSALIYFKKCEDVDETGMISLSSDMISEKLKLYMMDEDYANAEKMAAQLIAADPAEFKSYMVYFSILMAHQEYMRAEKVLQEANDYAEFTEDDHFALVLQQAALYLAQADVSDENGKDAYCNKAIDVLTKQKAATKDDFEKSCQIDLALAEAHMKNQGFDQAVAILTVLLDSSSAGEKYLDASIDKDDIQGLEDIEQMLSEDMMEIQEKIENGELSDDYGAMAPEAYDENGNIVRDYGNLFSNDDGVDASGDEEISISEPFDLPVEWREKAQFTLLSCYLAKDDFASAKTVAEVLKHSDNKYYEYFGLYAETLCYGKTSDAPEQIENKYAYAVSFFKNKMFEDPNDTLAVVFRARLYAEQGKFARAEELSNLLAEADKAAVDDYIEKCRKEN